jgi:hypothetical protein
VDDSIWRLPGPNGLLGQVTQEVSRGRHVAVILPSYLAHEELFVDGLVASLMRTLRDAGEEPRRAVIGDGHPLEQFADCLVFAEERPVVVSDLLDHADTAGLTGVLDCTSVTSDRYPLVSDLLTRIAVESRPRPAQHRPRFVVVGSRHLLPRLPGGQTDVTLEALWWWGRLTRWDVGARLAPIIEATPGAATLREVRLETVLEVCRWDLDIAEELAACWDGDPSSLPRTIEEAGKARGKTPGTVARTSRPAASRPDESLLEQWEDGRVDLWHRECAVSPFDLLDEPNGIEHAVWAAQARILLPWIEVRRQELLRRLSDRYGDAVRRAAAALDGAGRTPLEVGPLYQVTREIVPRTEPALRDAARQLMVGRNRLAHLQSLNVADQSELTRAYLALHG